MKQKLLILALASICILSILTGCSKECANGCGRKANPDCMAEMCNDCCAYWMGLNGCYANHKSSLDGTTPVTVPSPSEAPVEVTVEAPVTDVGDTDTIIIDPFENLVVTFGNFDGCGSVFLDTSRCSDLIKETVEFSYDTSVDGTLSNSDHVDIFASSHDDSIALSSTTTSVRVERLKEIDTVYGFSDGVAWYRYTYPYDDNNYLAAMDNTGRTLFTFDTYVAHFSGFVNGKAIVTFPDTNTIAFLDKSGNIFSTAPYDDILYCGNGYCVTQIHVEDFSNNHYLITIYNCNGEIVYQDTSVSKQFSDDVAYYGHDIFGFGGHYIDELVFVDTGLIVEDVNDDRIRYTSYITPDETCVLHNVIDHTLNILDGNGTWTSHPQEITERIYANAYNTFSTSSTSIYGDGVIVCYEGNYPAIWYYDVENRVSVDGTEKLAEYIDAIDFDRGIPYRNGILILPMEGADENSYISVVDKDWNILLEPTKCDSFKYGYNQAGFWYEYNGTYFYYDWSCQLMFESDHAYYFSGDMIAIDDFTWIDYSGNVVIDRIEYDNPPIIEAIAYEEAVSD